MNFDPQALGIIAAIGIGVLLLSSGLKSVLQFLFERREARKLAREKIEDPWETKRH